MLAVLGGNKSPKADDINKILSSVGVEADADRVAALIKALDGKNLDEVIAAGMEKVGSVAASSGGGGGGDDAGDGSGSGSDSSSSGSSSGSDSGGGMGLFD